MRIELYIEGQLIDLSDKIDYTLNKSFKDLLNPTDIKTEFSKTIEVPFTPRNNLIFGSIYRLDQQQYVSPTQSTFQWFDPAKKLKCELKFNQSTIFKGYAKMTSISNTIKKSSYNLNLFGDTALVLSELKKLVINSNPDPEELIDNKYIMTDYMGRVRVSRHTIKESFETGGPTDTYPAPLLYNKIGFTVPHMGIPEEFDCKSIYDPSYTVSVRPPITRYTVTENKISSLTDILVNNPDNDITNDTANVLVGDGILPRAMGEFRSYHMKPYIYFNQFFKHICDNITRLTDIPVELDSRWFNDKNPYWYKLVYMCKNFDTEAETTIKNTYTTESTQSMVIDQTVKPAGSSAGPVSISFTSVVEEEPILTTSDFLRVDPDKLLLLKGDLPLSINCVKADGTPVKKGHHIKDGNAWIFTVNTYITSTATPPSTMIVPNRTQKYYVVSKNTKVTPPAQAKKIIATDTQEGGSMFFKLPIDYASHTNEDEKYVYYRFEWSILNPDKDIMDWQTSDKVKFTLRSNQSSILTVTIKDKTRSYRNVVLEDLTQGITPYEFFMMYIKMFNLIAYVEQDKFYIQTYSTYFKNHKILDYSTKLDRSKDFTMTPVIFDNKYLKMNYDTPETFINKEYNEKTKFNYGELNIITNYNFNDETKDLFEDLNCYIPISPNVLNWDELYAGTFRVSRINETYGCYYRQENNKQSPEDYDKCFAFWNGQKEWDDTFRTVYITDDTEFEVLQDKYMYHLIDYGDGSKNQYNYSRAVTTTTYNQISNHIYAGPPLFTKRTTMFACFNRPVYDYTYQKPSATTGQMDIYTYCFEKYYNEIYNLNNYKLECHLFLTNLDYYNFKHNQFVTIDNQLFFINKIMDFNPIDSESTKCELIKVTNIYNYINNQ